MTQAEALDILKTGQNVFLTGQAGSGKTYVLNQYINYLHKKNVNVAVTATTGIAATHLNGTTIHSWSGLGIKDKLNNADFEVLLKKRYLRQHFLNTDVLIIDEISMLHAHQLDLVNQICQAFRQSIQPFGGMQVIFGGDFFQLPPVNRGELPTKMAMEADVWQTMDLKICYLDEQYRQADERFIKILNEIRKNNVSHESHELLFKCLNQSFDGGLEPTKLYTHNIDVEAINLQELQKISAPAKSYLMQSRGSQPLAALLQKGCLAPEKLFLKIGAKVMFVKNNFELGVVNGTIGRVVKFDENNYPVVKTSRGELVTAEPVEWMIEEDGRIKAEIRQIPLRLAWSITVHKSQGLSLDLVEIDLSKAFVPGMGYVALSRVRTLDGLRLIGLNEMALQVDKNVLALDEKFIEASKEAEKYLADLSVQEKINKQNKFLKNNPERPKKKSAHISNKEITKQMIQEKISLKEMAEKQGFSIGTIVKHIEKLTEKGTEIDLAYLLPAEANRQEIEQAFSACGFELLKPVFDYLNETYSYETLRLVKAWLVLQERVD